MKNNIQKIKSIIKNILAYSLYYSGILILIKNIVLRNKVLVITYHRVIPSHLRNQSFSHNSIIVDPINFEKQLIFIKRHFNVVNTSSMIKLFDGQSFLPDKSECLITFDDGWIDNYLYAFPILQKHSLNALIFTATDYIDNDKLFWQETMGHCLRQLINMGTRESDEFIKKHNIYTLTSGSKEQQMDLIRDYVRGLKSLPYDKMEDILHDLIEIVGNIDYGDIDKYMSWNQIKEMHENGIEFGSHACSHKILTRLDDQVVEKELQQSKRQLEDAITEKVDTIAYPNGNYNDHLGKLVKNAGYKIGFGTNYGYVTKVDDRFNLKRINISETNAANSPLMLATILGIFRAFKG